jgi:hypothetical protein
MAVARKDEQATTAGFDAQRHAPSPDPGLPTCVLVTSDQRLLRAAAAEGLAALDPEMVSVADLPHVLVGFG